MVQPLFLFQKHLLIDPGEIIQIPFEQVGIEFRILSVLQALLCRLDLLPKRPLILFELRHIPSRCPGAFQIYVFH